LQFIVAKEYSYEMLIKQAREHSLELKMYKSDIKIQNTLVNEAYGEYYPVITLSGNSEYNKDLSHNGGGVQSVGSSVISSNTIFQNSLTLGLNYTLYDFGQRDKKVQIQKDELIVKKFTLCDKKIELYKKILELYKNALVAKITISHYKHILSLKKELYDKKKRLFAAGEIMKTDVANAAVDVVELQNTLLQNSKEYEKTLFELSNLTNTKIDKDDNLKPFKPIVKQIKQKSFQESAKAKIINNQIQEKKKELDILKNSKKPVVSFYGSYNMYGSDVNSFTDSFDSIKSNSYKVGLGFKLNLFDGHKNKNKRAKVLLEIQRLKFQKQLYKKEFETQNLILKNKILYSSTLKEQNTEETKNIKRLSKMQKRLRKIKKTDLISYINYKVNILQKMTKIKTSDIQRVYEIISLSLQNTGASQCSQL
jgi:outer membrane protein TolC